MDREFGGLKTRLITRRRFVALGAGGAAMLVVGSACGDDDEDASQGSTASATPGGADGGSQEQSTVLVRDVLDHSLASDEWSGDFGHVTFRLWEARVRGEPVYFIRTDASDEDFATQEGLVRVPLLARAAEADQGLADLYLFSGGSDDQLPVLSSGPHMDDFSPAFRVHRVEFTGEKSILASVEEIDAAVSEGLVEIERSDIVVNYPVVKWPGGELPHDSVREAYLGDGQLLEPVDVENGTVTFKLHSCYPSTRYIVTDVTMPPMADGMHIAPAPGAAGLTEAGATAKILVFGNGVEGSGPMGFQKSVTDTVVGDPAWSPFWDHYTFVWDDAASPEVLKAEAAIKSREGVGELTRHAGTPDTEGQLFMVNCPVPVVAPVT